MAGNAHVPSATRHHVPTASLRRSPRNSGTTHRAPALRRSDGLSSHCFRLLCPPTAATGSSAARSAVAIHRTPACPMTWCRTRSAPCPGTPRRARRRRRYRERTRVVALGGSRRSRQPGVSAPTRRSPASTTAVERTAPTVAGPTSVLPDCPLDGSLVAEVRRTSDSERCRDVAARWRDGWGRRLATQYEVRSSDACVESADNGRCDRRRDGGDSGHAGGGQSGGVGSQRHVRRDVER